ncbi:MAG: enoyl-CoA hydratase/isomerase family protein [Bacteriovoracaceae bacterium]
MTNFEKMNQMKYLKYEIQNSVVILSINRPDKLNALNADVLKELKAFLIEIHSDKNFEFKGLVITGEGDKAFIAGADIKEMSNMSNDEALLFGQLGQEVTLMFEKLKIPVIAAVNGFALGGGLEIAMSCDFIYAVTTAKMGLPEVSLGLIPGFGGTQRLSKIIGRNQAREMIYTGKNVTAEEALNLGLVNKLFNGELN